MANVEKRYAKALFDSAKDKDKYNEYLSNLSKLYGETELADTLNSPKISKKIKMEILSEILPKDQVFINFIELLLNSKRFNLIENIAKKYSEFLNKEKNRINIKITSPFEVTKDEIQKISKKYEKIYKAKESEYEFILDEGLIGGIKVEIDGIIYDDTLKTKLNEIL